MKTILTTMLACAVSALAADPGIAPAGKPQSTSPQNPRIDYAQFRKIAGEVEPVRERRRVTEDQFAAMAAESGTVVLDARSADKFALRHIRGAVNLPFTEFTVESLAKVIPAKNTRVLIYCNNNFIGADISMPGKAKRASLNISTYIALATYGYTDIHELGPVLDVRTTKLPFVGTEVAVLNQKKPDFTDL